MAPELTVSAVGLPPADNREAAIAELSAACREIVETVHKLYAEHHGEGRGRIIGRLEERIYTMAEAIHRRQRELYLDRGIWVAIAHTEDGLPVRVSPHRKVNLWGAVE